MKKNKYFKYYFFCDEINNEIINTIHKVKNIVFVLNINDKDKNDFNNKLSIVQFLRGKKIQFLLYNNFQKCIKYQANGIFLDSKNKSILRPMLLKKKFNIVGAAHSQLEYIHKSKQSCQEIILSPIFENSKYSVNKILNVIRFNNISNHWKEKVIAMGGLSLKNINKIQMTRIYGVGFKRFLKDLGKSPIYKNGRFSSN
ncbi:ThiE Thiamine monophosphate synthase [Candidatus Pelagibacterales bacterium]